MRTSGLTMLLATGLLACGSDGDGDGDGDTGSSSSGSSAPTGSSSVGPSGGTTTEGTTSGVETATDGPGSTGITDSGTTQGESETRSATGSSTGGSSLPIDCNDGELPIRVDGGGGYETVGEGVAAVPPGGTLWICPGDYTLDDTVQIERDVSIVGASSDLVNLVAAAKVDRVFQVLDASVTFEGFALIGGQFGINVTHTQGGELDTTTMRDVQIRDCQQAGVYLSTTFSIEDGFGQAVFEDVVVENVASEEVQAIAGVALLNVNATFLDTIIRDNVTRSGGLELLDAEVTFEGGQVIRNEAMFPNGGGARIVSDLVSAQFTIVDSDWGEGAEEENLPNDVDCGSGASNDVGWLGSPANAVCATDIKDCCTPQ